MSDHDLQVARRMLRTGQIGMSEILECLGLQELYLLALLSVADYGDVDTQPISVHTSLEGATRALEKLRDRLADSSGNYWASWEKDNLPPVKTLVIWRRYSYSSESQALRITRIEFGV